MYMKDVPNKSTKCIVFEQKSAICNLLLKDIMNEAKGKYQVDAAFDFRDNGYTLMNHDKKINASIDKYITRVQKRFEKRNMVFAKVYYKIYYGQIGINNEYGYYIYEHEKK